MPKILVKSKDPSIIPKLNRNKKPSYELAAVELTDSFETLCAEQTDVHAIIVDSDLIKPSDIAAIKEKMDDQTFPVILLAGQLSEEEAGRWIACGVTDIFQQPAPCAVMARRLGAAIQLYCVTQHLHGEVKDQLTNLFNRGAFYHFAKEMMLKNPEDEYTVIISDIEHFKRINERYGEEKGDELLRYIGSVLAGLNSEDILFARYGGDQFVGIVHHSKDVPDIDLTFIQQEMQKLYQEAPLEHFTVKFGIYEKVDKTLPVSIMCDRALMALKTIKYQYRRNAAKYTPQLQMKLAREQLILDTMEQALAENQFQVYYQPKHDTESSAIVGAEALVRWIHPNYGFLSPAEFIPLFEKSGFISKLDEYVLKTVCRDIKNMLEKGIPVVPVSVNASRMDFAADNFLPKLRAPIEQSGIDPNLLHMEITESVYMEDAEVLSPIIDSVKAFGIQIELDDFGSGFSSLGIISKFPVDIIKLDISLIKSMEAQPAIVESIVHLMHILGHKVIAEGVENDMQLELLRKIGCDFIQGYYYSKPLTYDGFCNYVLSHEA